ncbi:MAG: hypothetical protein U0704_05375 [Candidatus Eisenbacteria bacterium]
MRSRALRSLAVAAACVLLACAAFAPRLRADAARGAGPAWASYPTCTLPIVDTGWDTTIALPPYAVIAQQVPFHANIAACSLKVSPSYTFGRLDVVQWDPAALQPDPTTVALRSVSLNSSNMAWNWLHIPMSPPLVTKPLAHVADPPSNTGALVYTGTYAYNATYFRYQRDGDPSMPTGYWRYGYPWQPLPGPHGVHGVSICGGDPALQDLRVAQSVMHTDAMIPRTYYEALQRFRVPKRVRLQWAEVALDSLTGQYYSIGSVSVLRGGIGSTPPPEMPVADVTASLWVTTPLPAWASHFDFDSSMVLEPGEDYWLRVTTAHYYALRAHAITGNEGADFASGVGPLWLRFENGYNWLPAVGKSLAFRIIGDTIGVTDAGAVPRRSPLELRCSPNPARGFAQLAWSGAERGVRLDVLDARGRRVGGVADVPGASGTWGWTAVATGRPLAPGLYFVRATDRAGHSAIARVALVR